MKKLLVGILTAFAFVSCSDAAFAKGFSSSSSRSSVSSRSSSYSTPKTVYKKPTYVQSAPVYKAPTVKKPVVVSKPVVKKPVKVSKSSQIEYDYYPIQDCTLVRQGLKKYYRCIDRD